MTHFQSGNAAFRRMAEFLREPSDIEDTGQQKVQEFSRLEVRGLTYAHPGSHSAQLKDIHFQVRAGEVVGLVGLTGSGKSTLIDLLSKLYPAPRGTILVNDQPLSEISTAHWRQMLSVASQEPFIFSRPLVENLALGQGAWRWDDLRWATELVQLEGEILNLPEKERTLLGERGVNLSGGQRQRLALARALLKPSALLIIDDALSAVDAKTEASILERLQARLKMRRDRAVILVSHRLSSLRFADRIIVLKDGAIEAEGSAEALGRSSPTFQNLAALQELEGR